MLGERPGGSRPNNYTTQFVVDASGEIRRSLHVSAPACLMGQGITADMPGPDFASMAYRRASN